MAVFQKLYKSLALFLLLAGTRGLAAVAAPTLSPGDGEALVRFNVNLSCVTSGAEIHYTLNGAEPTSADPWVNSGGTISITTDCVLKAKAFTSTESSATTSGTYILTGDISAGAIHSYGLSTSGRVWSWGQQQYGRLSNGLSASAVVSTPVQAKYSASIVMEDASMVSSGWKHGLILKNNGDVYAVGRNDRGNLGNYSTTDVSYPVRVLKSTTAADYLTNCVAVDAAEEFSLALGSNGKVYAWGDKANGRLGDGEDSGYRSVAKAVTTSASGNPELGSIVGVSANHFSSLVREANALEVSGAAGRVWVWGLNGSSQLGNGSGNIKRASLLMLNSSTVLNDAWDITTGGWHSAVVRWKNGDSTLQGSVWSFGNQQYGRLGNQQSADSNVSYPVQVVKSGGVALNGIVSVSASAGHTLALELPGNGGKVWSWGRNANGELGDGATTTNRTYASTVKTLNSSGATVDLQNIVRISTGGDDGLYFSIAVAVDGSVYAWGANAAGQLGLGNTSTSTPWLAKKIPNLRLKFSPPSVVLAATLPVINRPGANVTLSATPTDADGLGDIVKVEFFNNSTLLGQATGSPWTYAYNSLTADSYSVKAIVTDTSGLTGESAVIPFTIFPSTAPTVTLGASVITSTAPGSVTLTATPADANGIGDITKVGFYSGTTLLEEKTSPPWSVTRTGLTAGSYSFTAKVTDSTGLTGTSSAQVVTISSTAYAPTVSLQAELPAVNSAGAAVLLKALPEDLNGSSDIAKVQFYNGSTLLSQVTSAPWNYNYPGLAAGSYSVKAVVTDAGGLTGQSSETSFTILPATAPTVTLASSVVSSTAPGSVTLTATPADANGSADIVKVGFYDGTTLLEQKTSAPWTITRTGLAAGSYAFTAKVTDASNLVGTSGIVNVTITTTSSGGTGGEDGNGSGTGGGSGGNTGGTGGGSGGTTGGSGGSYPPANPNGADVSLFDFRVYPNRPEVSENQYHGTLYCPIAQADPEIDPPDDLIGIGFGDNDVSLLVTFSPDSWSSQDTEIKIELEQGQEGLPDDYVILHNGKKIESFPYTDPINVVLPSGNLRLEDWIDIRRTKNTNIKPLKLRFSVNAGGIRKTSTLQLLPIAFITPSGDPVDAFVDAGDDPENIPDGANEFTFSTATSGVLTMNLKAKVPGIGTMPPAEQAKFKFELGTIGFSSFSWDVENPNGKATINGEILTATATYTGLPDNNSDFGLKKAKLKYDDSRSGAAEFEVFFPLKAKNHPDGQANSPNWFYYWQQALPDSYNLEYDADAPMADLMGVVKAMNSWKYNESFDKAKITIYDASAGSYLSYGVGKLRSGIDCFIACVLHESTHVSQISRADSLVPTGTPNSPWVNGWSFMQSQHNHWSYGNDNQPGVAGKDDDGDNVVDNLISGGPGELGSRDELGHDADVNLTHENAVSRNWPAAWPLPQEVIYPQSEIENEAILADQEWDEDQAANLDWANPGKNHATVNDYED